MWVCHLVLLNAMVWRQYREPKGGEERLGLKSMNQIVNFMYHYQQQQEQTGNIGNNCLCSPFNPGVHASLIPSVSPIFLTHPLHASAQCCVRLYRARALALWPASESTRDATVRVRTRTCSDAHLRKHTRRDFKRLAVAGCA